MVVLDLFCVLVAKCTLCKIICSLWGQLVFFVYFQWDKLCWCLHVLKMQFLFYTEVSKYFQVLINWLNSPVGVLCKHNMSNLDSSVSSSTAQISTSFSLQLFDISILLTCLSLRTKIHTSTFCRLLQQKLDPNIYPGNMRRSRSCSSMWCLLKHSIWGFMLLFSKECINSTLLFLSP